jgi:hypothetical protein
LGLVWRETPAVQKSLGWATGYERGFIGTIQDFIYGTLFYTDEGQVLIIYANGTWEKLEEPSLTE